MTHVARSLFLLVLAVASLALAQSTAALDVRGPDGARIVIDASDEYVLVDGEVFVVGLAPGVRTLRAEVEGYYPLEATLTLERGQVLAVTLSLAAFAPRATTTRALFTATLVPTSASLSLQCFPMACELAITGENDLTLTQAKGFGEDTMLVSGLPAGAYSVTAAATVAGEPRSTDFILGLCDGETLMIFVDFMAIPIVARLSESAFPNCAPLTPVEITR